MYEEKCRPSTKIKREEFEMSFEGNFYEKFN